MDYETMTIEQLNKENQKLQEKRAGIKTEQLKICAVLEKMVTLLKVKKKIDSMTDKEKAIATQVLSTKAIISEEKVGAPGMK